MKLIAVFAVLVSLMLAAGPVQAERTSTRLTRETINNQVHAFAIKAGRFKEADGGHILEFRVTVKAGKAPFLPRRTGTLEMLNGNEFVSFCEVQQSGRGRELVYTFRVAEKYTEKSHFMFGEAVENPEAGGAYYWFVLKDFIDPK